MAINPEEIRWASNDENDPVTSAPNKVQPEPEFRDSGLLREEPLRRDHINYQFDKIYDFFVDVQAQIDGLAVGALSSVLQTIYTVGTYYISDDSTEPATKFGFGTWTRVKGKFLVGLDEADTDFDGVGENGGAKSHTHTDTFAVAGHSLTVAELPSEIPFSLQTSTVSSSNTNPLLPIAGESQPSTAFQGNINWNGAGQAHTHTLSGGIQSSSSLPPYEVTYIWKRTA